MPTTIYSKEIENLVQFADNTTEEIDHLFDDHYQHEHGEKTLFNITPSQFTEFAIKIPNKGEFEPFSFKGREYLKAPYDTPSDKVLLKFSRQSEKSTFLGNKSLAYCATIKAFKVLYVNATETQAKVFSTDRLKEPIELSSELSTLVDYKLSQNVFFKQFKNRSQIRIRYAFLHADRARGISSDMVTIDEIQDILYHNIPVIEQCSSHSPYKLSCYCGTPKTVDNTIEVFWSEHSTQNEWAIPCESCGLPKDSSTWHWNILGPSNVGRTGPICARCGKRIYPDHPSAQWVSLQPITEENRNRISFEGYHISQLMVPWIVKDPDEWRRSILVPVETYDTATLYNEVFGLSYDSGQRPLTKKQVKACCNDRIKFADVEKLARKCLGGVAAGLDHGTGENSSYSVLTLGGYLGDEFQIFFAHRFIGEDLDPQIQLVKIAKLLRTVKFTILGCDYGGGFDRNAWLISEFGLHKVVKYQYTNIKKKVQWEEGLVRFLLNRTEVMTDVFSAFKKRKVLLPCYHDFVSPYASDLINIYSEYNRRTNLTKYDVRPGKSDDTFHSILYCFLASMFIKPRPDILIPAKEGDVDFNPSIVG